ncbi:MAG: PilT protein domain protein [Enterovirga sp.]|jgi:ribonuclease VapC|nr:PilT protein domain protein [Enterovirga sp.]
MILDASALTAILLDEDDGEALSRRLEQASEVLTHPLSVFETVSAVARESKLSIVDATETVAGFLAALDIRVIELGERETIMALEAHGRYGRGRHPAKLNMGDCFSYAVAKLRGMPLLYKGEEFSQTDLAPT